MGDKQEALAGGTAAGGAVPCGAGSPDSDAKLHGAMEIAAKKSSEKFTKSAEAHLKKQRLSAKACNELKGKQDKKKTDESKKKHVKEEKVKKALSPKKEEGKKKKATMKEENKKTCKQKKEEEKKKKATAKKNKEEKCK